MATKENKDLQIYVGNIPNSISENDLIKIFKAYNIVNKRFVKNNNKTFGFLELGDKDNVIRAVKEMNDTIVDQRNLKVRAMDKSLQKYVESSKDGEENSSEILLSKENNSVTDDLCGPPALLENTIPNPVDSSTPDKTDTTDDLPPPLEYISGYDVDSYSKEYEKMQYYRYGHNKPDHFHHRPVSHCVHCCCHYDVPDYDYNEFYEEKYPRYVTLLVTNFPYGTTEREIYDLFEDFHPIDVYVDLNVPTGRREDYTKATVVVSSIEMAETAIMELDNTIFKKRSLLVSFAEDDGEYVNDYRYPQEAEVNSIDRYRMRENYPYAAYGAQNYCRPQRRDQRSLMGRFHNMHIS